MTCLLSSWGLANAFALFGAHELRLLDICRPEQNFLLYGDFQGWNCETWVGVGEVEDEEVEDQGED